MGRLRAPGLVVVLPWHPLDRHVPVLARIAVIRTKRVADDGECRPETPLGSAVVILRRLIDVIDCSASAFAGGHYM